MGNPLRQGREARETKLPARGAEGETPSAQPAKVPSLDFSDFANHLAVKVLAGLQFLINSEFASLPNSVIRPGSWTHAFGGGGAGLGNGGTAAFGLVKLSALTKFPTSLEASRAVSGDKPHLHSISFRAEV